MIKLFWFRHILRKIQFFYNLIAPCDDESCSGETSTTDLLDKILYSASGCYDVSKLVSSAEIFSHDRKLVDSPRIH